MAGQPMSAENGSRPQERRVEVVALVTSAGGLEALSSVLGALPADFPAAVVVAQHLGGQGSKLVEILERRIELSLEWARDGCRIAPGRVTICPPRSLLEVLPDRSCAVRRAERTSMDRPLDLLLSSVADSVGAASVAVVLSGMGNDGSGGAAAVTAAGGLVIAQSEETAEHPSMPRAVVDRGAANLILPLHDIGAQVIDVVAGLPLPVPSHEAEAVRRIFGTDGEIARLAREIDWAATPLGTVSNWPEAQVTATQLAMSAPYAVSLHLGPEHILIFNEACIPMMAEDYERVFGVPSVQSYPEVADMLLPVLAQARAGTPVHFEARRVPYVRGGRMRDAWFDGSYVAIATADGTVLGVQQTYFDRTEEVLGRRRLETLNRLASTPTARSRTEALEAGIAILAEAEDVPFSAAYLLDPRRSGASLVAVSGTEPGAGIAPRQLRLTPGAIWPLHQIVGDTTETVLDDVAERFRGQQVTDERLSLEQAVLIPLRDQGVEGAISGVLILGVRPTLRLDSRYRGFLSLLGETIGAKVNEAHARQRERDRLERLAELDRVKTEFFSNVSHEFRTPLTLMLGPLEELTHDGAKLSPEQKADLELIHRNTRRLLRLVGTMLDFSQIEAGRLRARFAPVDLAERTREIVGQFESAAARAGLELRIDVGELPEPVWVDVEMWEKVVSNLLSNALKFTFEGEIEVTLRALPKHAELVVRDTGVGIPDEELPNIFKRFHRVRETRARTYEGAGIGLALVDELVRRHHGRIRAASTLGEGTTLTVWIPFGRRPTLPESPPTEPPQAPAVAAAIAQEAMQWGGTPEALQIADDDSALRQSLRAFAPGARVLVADDNADMRDYLKRLLSPHWKVETAADGTTALACARRKRPDLIVADVMMPGLDGFALLRELRDDPSLSSLPVVLVTARAGEESAIEGLLAGADDYIVKPFSARELVARVGGQLELARARSRAAELNAFLVKFTDTARSLADPGAVAETACRMLIDHLGASRTTWTEIDHEAQEYVADPVVVAGGASGEATRWPLDASEPCTAEHLAGQTVVYTDSATDPRVSDAMKRQMAKRGLRAGIAVPVLLDGKLRAVVSVSDEKPRLWTIEDVTFVEAVAGRAWAEAERARAEAALRASEERHEFLLRLSDALRAESDEGVVARVAVELTAAQMRVDRCWITAHSSEEGRAVVAHEYRRPDLQSMRGEYRYEDFPAAAKQLEGGTLVFDDMQSDAPLAAEDKAAKQLEQGTLVFDDIQSDASLAAEDKVSFAALRIGSRLAVYLKKREGRVMWSLVVATEAPRKWTQEEAALLEDASERTWAAVERARAEKALRASEERLRRVLDGMGEGFGLLSPDFTILEHNREALRMDGRARDEIVGRSHWEAFPGTEKSELGCLLKKAMAERVPVSLEHQYAWEESRALWLEMRAYPMSDGSLAVFWRDVTDRHEAQDALRESEKKYRTVFESIDEGFLILDVIYDGGGTPIDALYLESNPAASQLTGVPDLTGHRLSEVMPGALPDALEIYDRVARTGIAEHHERYHPPSNRWYDGHISPVASVGAADDAHRVAVVFQDITARKRAESALRESEERQAFLLRFSDALRAEPDADRIAESAIRLLSEQMRLDRCYVVRYVLEDDRAYVTHQLGNDSVPPLPHELVLSDYPEALEVVREQTFVVEDDFERQGLSDEERRNSAALGMRAMVASTARQGKGTPLWSMAAVSSQPRRWTPDEIALVEEAAERTWAAVERARAETALRDSETRQAFLLGLSDALRPLVDAADIKRTAAILLGRHLGVDRAFWSEMVEDEWLIDDVFEPAGPSLAPGRYSAGVYGRWTMNSLKAGLPAAIGDTAADTRLRPPERDALRGIGVAAVIGVPLLRDGEVVATLSVHSHKPRAWTEAEVELVQETADRTWPAVQRARTEAILRDSEERFRVLAEASPLGVAVTDVNKSIIVYANRAYETIIGYEQHELEGQPSTSVYYDPADRSWLAEMRQKGRITGHKVRFKRKDGSPVWVSINVAPINFGGRPAIIGVVQDISARRDASNAEQRDPDA